MANMQDFKITIRSDVPRSISLFAHLPERPNNFFKEVSFVRHIGFEEQEPYLREIIEMDETLYLKMQTQGVGYLRISLLTKAFLQNPNMDYAAIYEHWRQLPQLKVEGQSQVAFPFVFENTLWETAFQKAIHTVMAAYRQYTPQASDTMVRNFFVKLMGWIDFYFPKLFLHTKVLSKFPKFVYCGDLKLQDYLFLYLLALCGCDVLYLNPEKDLTLPAQVLAFSTLQKFACCRRLDIPEFDVNQFQKQAYSTAQPAATQPVSQPETTPATPVRIQLPEHPSRQRTNVTPTVTTIQPPQEATRELPYEELAKLASSVVMIEVYDPQNKCFKTGSGVIINNKGYVLTNFHVACDGHYYGIRLEEEEEIHYTSELIKYNPVFDLALLRIDVNRRAIPVYQGSKKLVRGQRVVAIGSPLGLFNSVSDGIIAGFRKLDDVSMVQFTAPTSHGSSGGALIDLYGRLIGIITAGFDDGQNLNLAVDQYTILNFVKGFL